MALSLPLYALLKIRWDPLYLYRTSLVSWRTYSTGEELCGTGRRNPIRSSPRSRFQVVCQISQGLRSQRTAAAAPVIALGASFLVPHETKLHLADDGQGHAQHYVLSPSLPRFFPTPTPGSLLAKYRAFARSSVPRCRQLPRPLPPRDQSPPNLPVRPLPRTARGQGTRTSPRPRPPRQAVGDWVRAGADTEKS